LINKRDILLFVGLVAIALLAAWALQDRNTGGVARISIDGQILLEVKLSQDKIIVLESLENVNFQVKDGAIAFVKSDCPDQICVRSGFLSRQGQMAACLPNRVSLIVIRN